MCGLDRGPILKPMDWELRKTEDGSHTLYLPGMEETYHSRKGALSESQYVYLDKGFHHFAGQEGSVSIFEMGLGTGLNALLTAIEAENTQTPVVYHAVEKHPLPEKILSQLNYAQHLKHPKAQEWLESIHQQDAGEHDIHDFFKLRVDWFMDAHQLDLEAKQVDLIYYDAFAPNRQADVWNAVLLQKMHKHVKLGGLLTTYCSQSAFQRTLKSIGFTVEKIPGPLGKREMVQAWKLGSTNEKR